MPNSIDRRSFVRGAVAACVAGSALQFAASAAGVTAKPKLRKAVKYDMIGIKGSIEEKFNLIKSVGFLGVEIDSPLDINREEAVAASKKTGIAIHGVIDSTHWKVRHSDPSPEVRAKALEDLLGALKDAHTYGASTVLLVPGAVRNPQTENYDQVWERSTEQVKKAIPVAKELGVRIAIEVVWNNFITKPEQLVKYVDHFEDPTVGAYFDCSNMVKFGVPPADWIRALGKRMLKFDFKGYNGKTNQWVNIGEGTEDWPEIVKALGEIGYDGWATAEVDSGGEAFLRDVSEKMDKILELKK